MAISMPAERVGCLLALPLELGLFFPLVLRLFFPLVLRLSFRHRLRACVRACVHGVCACARACMRAWLRVHASMCIMRDAVHVRRHVCSFNHVITMAKKLSMSKKKVYLLGELALLCFLCLALQLIAVHVAD